MKKLLLTLTILSCMLVSSAQTLKFQIGPSFSKLDYSFTEIHEESITGLNIMAGLDYLDLKIFNLSSNIGYIMKGGQDSVWNTNDLGQIVDRTLATSKLNYLTLNTTANLKIPLGIFIPYIFAGPRVDYLVSYTEDAAFIEQFDDNDYLNRFQYGIIAGAGLSVKITRITVGAAFNYYANIGKVADFQIASSPDITLKDKTYSITAVLGVKLF